MDNVKDVYGVRTHHPEYDKRYPQWKKMRDIIEGEDKIKQEGLEYLPPPSHAKQIYKSWDGYVNGVYEAYKDRTPFSNFTAQIKDCLHGMLEYKGAEIEVPNSIKNKKWLENIDLRGDSAAQFFSDIDDDVLVTGFGGILIDIPNADPNISVDRAEKIGIRPYMTYYKAESIINWRYLPVNGVNKLVLVVLEEEVDNPNENEFGHTKIKQYRVLRLVGNVYYQALYQPTKSEEGEALAMVGKPKPIMINNETLDYIPFVMLPFSVPVKPILYDIANLNIHHYQVSADYQNGAHLTSRPSLWFTGHEPELDEETGEPIPIEIGTDTVWQLPEKEAKVGVCTFSGEGIQHLEKSLDRLEAQIITLSSHIISPDKKTAENKDSIALHRQGEDAKLASYGRYNSYRFTEALRIWCEFCQCTEDELLDVKVQLSADFTQISFDANAVNSIANIFSQGKLPLRSLYYMLKKGNYLEPDMSYEDFIYLLDLEAASLSPQEVDEAYKLYKKNGEKKNLPQKDYYSPEKLYSDSKVEE